MPTPYGLKVRYSYPRLGGAYYGDEEEEEVDEQQLMAERIGHVVLALIRESFYPIPRAADYDCLPRNAASLYQTIHSVVQHLASQDGHAYMEHALKDLHCHQTCGVELSTEAQRQTLAAQAKKTGLSLYLATKKRANNGDRAETQTKKVQRR